MKLEHDVVQDLYPLYIENDLSPSVKVSVDEHLQACEACRIFYETGERSITVANMDEPKVSSSLDDKIILKMKLNRLRLVTVVLATIIFSMVLTDYVKEREKMFMAVDNYYGTIRNFSGMFDVVKTEGQSLEFLQEMLHQLFEENMTLEEHINIFERKNINTTAFHLSLNTQRLNSMFEVLKIRYDQGRWTETDEAAFQSVKDYFIEQEKVMRVEYRKTHHGYSSYLHNLDVKTMDQFYEKMNLLSYSYTRFHKLPDQMKIMNEAELKSLIANTLDIDRDKIKLKKESPINDLFVYHFDIGAGFGGTIDAITGQITNYTGNTGALNDGPLISEEEAESKAKEYLTKIYGENLNLELVPSGFNYNSFSDDPRHKVYSFKAVPNFKGIALYSPLESETIINVNARNGELESFDHNRYIPSFEKFDQVDLSAILENKGNKQPVIIYSALTGNFELVYMESDLDYYEEGKFISATTGLHEKIYIEER